MAQESEIPFNKPFITGKELHYIGKAVALGNIGGDGFYTRSCSDLLQQRFGIHRLLMTPSCTAALEMAAQLAGIGPGDEVIMPSFTFVSTASAVARLGGKPVFVDIRPDTLNINEKLVDEAVTSRTKAIIPVHYGGVSCQMNEIMSVAEKRNLLVIEDAAQGVNASFEGRSLGSIGHLGTFSFHETKNFICGEGGALCINSEALVERAEILRDKGTNRQKFFRGQVDKYTWVDLGSSNVPSEICAAFLFAQLELMDEITERRRHLYENYRLGFEELEVQGRLRLPRIPSECQSNYHMFYLLMNSLEDRTSVIDHLKGQGIQSVFHYVPLHSSPMAKSLGCAVRELPVTEGCSSRLVRLPFFYELNSVDQQRVIDSVRDWAKTI